MASSPFLLFSGTNDRAVFALARVMTECGVGLQIIARGRGDRVLYSRYARNVVHVRSSDRLDPDDYAQCIVAARGPDDAAGVATIVPISEYFNRASFRARRAGVLPADCRVALGDEAAYVELSDKASCTRLFRSAGIRTPRAYLSAAAAPLPFVAKPHRNFDGNMRSLYPRIIESEAQREALLRGEDAGEYFAQEYLRGRSCYLLGYLARDGRCFVSSQENLAQQAGGKSIVLAETARFHEEPVAGAVLDLLRRRDYTGFVMVEFIDDGAGPCFIELNPRPWGPLQLCADHRCGIVEGFIGDWACGDSGRYQWRAARRPAAARYAWIGGIVENRRRRERLAWRRPRIEGCARIVRSLTSDVYLRRDSLRVFARECLGAGLGRSAA